ncbi:hypothetical protein BGW38_003719 [Lunasporangiospora selenospora]|uniref:Uncharacterized protein n=1 Tax=Lunasporangiospora selenospora TaxID=979761 RepID=A0A9P6KHH5_9FUNG|nr:hypothetical protein BGW38_003719 [Lunasporangiospora selenospora]
MTALLALALVQAETVTGVIRSSPGGSNFVGSFFIGDVQYNFLGKLRSRVPAFSSEKAQLTFDHVNQLREIQFFNVIVGHDNLDLEFYNGASITGLLDNPLPEKSVAAGRVGIFQR